MTAKLRLTIQLGEAVAAVFAAAKGLPGRESRAGQLAGWAEPLRNPPHVAITSMGFASTVAGLSFCGRMRSTHPTRNASPRLQAMPHGRRANHGL